MTAVRLAEPADHRIRLALLVGAVVSFAMIGGLSGLVVVFSFVVMLVLHELGPVSYTHLTLPTTRYV